MKKVVLKLDLHDDRSKQKAIKAVSGLSGIDSIAVDMKEKKLTVTGDVDPVVVVSKLRKLGHTDIVSVGPAKEPEKKKEPPAKTDDGEKKDKNEQIALWAYPAYDPYRTTQYYVVHNAEENPTGCVIC